MYYPLLLLQVSLVNQLADWQVLSMPSSFKDYTIDGKVPCDHSFLWLSFNHFALFYSAWSEGKFGFFFHILKSSNALLCKFLVCINQYVVLQAARPLNLTVFLVLTSWIIQLLLSRMLLSHSCQVHVFP